MRKCGNVEKNIIYDRLRVKELPVFVMHQTDIPSFELPIMAISSSCAQQTSVTFLGLGGHI